ncbi:MAG: hypothetical protein ACR2MG_01355 [Pyrinomonadaceae bacterium]
MNPETPNKKETTNENESAKPKQRDRWDKMQLIGQLLLPIMIALVGISFTYYQSKTADERQKADKTREEERQKTDRVTNLLDHLASDKERANLLALKVIEYLNKKGEIDAELVSSVTGTLGGGERSDKVVESSTETLAQVANESPNQETKQTAKNNLQELTENKNAKVALSALKSLAKVDKRATVNLPARVYLHILKGTSREQAETLENKLEGNNLNVPGIDSVDTVPNRNELRYFFGSNQEDIEKITRIMKELNISITSVDLSSRYPNSPMRPRHYEIWFGKGN